MPVINAEALIQDRVAAIDRYHTQCGIVKAQLDVSGGIDSAVMAMLLKISRRPRSCIFVHSNINTSPHQTNGAVTLCEALHVPLYVGNFTAVYDDILNVILRSLSGNPEPDATKETRLKEVRERMIADPTIEGSIRSTLRAPLGRAYNRIMGGGIRHGTGNECEDRFLRFYQKGGDGEVDTNPLAMLSKTEVYQLAYALGHHLEIYDAVRPIIEAVPSPDLWGIGDVHSDETELLSWTGAPFTYGRIDPETGEITHIGTIERVSRFLDYYTEQFSIPSLGQVKALEVLFDDNRMLNDFTWSSMVAAAKQSEFFNDFSRSEVETLLAAARKVERSTRHKMNPNIPTLGDRCSLVDANILTDKFPSVQA